MITNVSSDNIKRFFNNEWTARYAVSKLATSRAGFTAGVAMSENEEWISAASALALLGMNHLTGARTVCNRAHAGSIKARATTVCPCWKVGGQCRCSG